MERDREAAAEKVPVPDQLKDTKEMAARKLSVREAFRDKVVLVTGVTGFVGSMVLEQILRVCPQVDKVYVLIRQKRSLEPHKRLELLVNSGLFNNLWDKRDVFTKLCLIEGDVTAPNLGLHPASLSDVLKSVNIVIHCAAAVALDDPIQKTLRNNYVSTKNVLELCREMLSLQAYTHISTSYVNINLPKHSVAEEKIYPLKNGDAVVTHEEVVTELLRLPEEAANAKVEVLKQRWGFCNTYSIGKNLGEQLVSDYHKNHFPCTIVRPSLISGIAGDPYPGYIGNLAGGAGYAIAFAFGFFEDNSMAWDAKSICDGIPGDTVTSVILAAAAATVEKKTKGDDVPIYHACSSTTYPLTNYDLHAGAEEFFTKEPPKFCLLWGKYPPPDPNYMPNMKLVKKAKKRTARKVRWLCWLLRRFHKYKLAKMLYTGWRAWDDANTPRYDLDLYFSTENTRALDAMLVDEEREDIRCLYTSLNGDWTRYGRTYLAGVKTLLLKTAVKDNSNHDFHYIPPCDPPISLPRSVERCPSVYSRASAGSRKPSLHEHHTSVASLNQLARRLSNWRSVRSEDSEAEFDSGSESEEEFLEVEREDLSDLEFWEQEAGFDLSGVGDEEEQMEKLGMGIELDTDLEEVGERVKEAVKDSSVSWMDCLRIRVE